MVYSYGKYKFTRLPFGLSTAPEVSQRVNTKIFGDIPNVEIYFDDIIVCGKIRKEHDTSLDIVCQKSS